MKYLLIWCDNNGHFCISVLFYILSLRGEEEKTVLCEIKPVTTKQKA